MTIKSFMARMGIVTKSMWRQAVMEELQKAQPLGPGERWITVHPSGDKEGRGIPVLIRESQGQPGVYHVIGGAGGKLNYLRLTGIKSEEEYREEAKQRAKERREKQKQEEAGKPEEEKERAKMSAEELKTERMLRERAFIDQVAQIMGWKDYDVDKEKIKWMSEGAQKMVIFRHHQKLLSKARQVVEETRNRLLIDHELRAAAELSDVPLRPGSETDVSLADLDPDARPSGALGYQREVSERAIAAIAEEDLTPEALEKRKESFEASISYALGTESVAGNIAAKHYSEAAKHISAAERAAAEGDLAAAAEQVILAERAERKAERRLMQGDESAMASELMAQKMADMQVEASIAKQKGVHAPAAGLVVKAVEAAKAKQILLAERQLREQQKAIRQEMQQVAAGKELDMAAFTLRAYEIEEQELKAAVAADLQELERASKARTFLEAVESAEADITDIGVEERRKSLKKYIAAGTYNAMNNLALTLTQTSLIDRDVLDTLGMVGSAQLLAAHLRELFPAEDIEAVIRGLEAYHVERHDDLTESAIAEAEEAYSEAKELVLESVENATDLREAQRLNARRKRLIEQARAALGTALGELEGRAALLQELKTSTARDAQHDIEVPMEDMDLKTMIKQARALGLARNDYHIDVANELLIIRPEGWHKLLKPVSAEEVKRRTEIQAIKNGARDEDGWLPKGIVKRLQNSWEDPAEEAVSFTTPLALDGDMGDDEVREAILDYIGQRLADGEPARVIRDDMYSLEFRYHFVDQHGDTVQKVYEDVLRSTFPITKVEQEEERWKSLAERYVEKYRTRTGDTEAEALHKQRIQLDETTYEAVHRALATSPYGVVAFTPLGQMTSRDQRTLRDYFWRKVKGMETPQERRKQETKAKQEKAERPKDMQWDIFGNLVEVEVEPTAAPETQEQKDEWQLYVRAMGGVKRAYSAIQDLIKGDVMANFATEYGRVTGSALKTGQARVANWERHLLGILPPERIQQLLEQEQSDLAKLYARVAARVGGRFAPGERRELGQAILRALQDQQQLSMFREVGLPQVERLTIGEMAEGQLKGIFKYVAKNFDPDQPVDIPKFEVSMSGKYVKQQRGVKAFKVQKRMGLFYGVGSGKSLISIGAFTDLHSEGQVKRAIFAVPSIVQGQFGSEMLRFTEPGRYSWFSRPGASKEERMQAYRDPHQHMVVMTHQALRDDIVDMTAGYLGVNAEEAANRIKSSNRAERKAMIREALAANGIDWQMMVLDEGHDALNRRGKPDSLLANVIDALADTCSHYMPMTGTPVKNSVDEAFDWLTKLDPEKYPPQSRNSFIKRYGVNTTAAREALKREIDPYFYADRVPLKSKAYRHEEKVQLSEAQQQEYDRIMEAFDRARLANAEGRVDVEAIKVLSPNSFAGQPEEKHEEIARSRMKSVGVMKESALNRVVNYTEAQKNAKIQKVLEIVRRHRGEGKPGVIFAHNLESVKQIAQALKADGHRVASLTGQDSSDEKFKKRLMFRPESGEPEVDIIVLSDAGATGANLQRGQFLINLDTPETAKTHEQRCARIHRLGQENDVDLYDIVSDTPHEDVKRERLKRKYALADIFQSPAEMLDDTGLAHYIMQARAVEQQAEGGSATLTESQAG